MLRSVLSLIGAVATMIAAAVIAYPPFLRQAGSGLYLVAPLILLAVYAALAVVVVRSVSARSRRTLRIALAVGVILGVVEVAKISVETFAGLSGRANIATTAPLILGPFLVWALVAGWAARADETLRSGMPAAIWTAMITTLIGISYGCVLLLAVPHRLARNLISDPDFVRSGWTDVRAYALANTFDNAFIHLLGGLVVATITGLIGAAVGMRLVWLRHPASPRS